MKRVALIDADVLQHEAAAGAQCDMDWGDGNFVDATDQREANRRFDRLVDLVQRTLAADQVVLAFSDPDRKSNWRKDVLRSYKATRTGTKPSAFQQLLVHAGNTYRFVHWEPRLEGDDLLGLMATGTRWDGWERVIVSPDKDMRTVPGLLYNNWKPQLGTTLVTTEEADRYHLFQALSGDTVDGYTGVPGIGPKKAEKWLTDESAGATLWGRVVACYESKGLTEWDALVQARVARILRAGEFDVRTKEVKLWSPPQTEGTE
jgi:DNA polymerase-1